MDIKAWVGAIIYHQTESDCFVLLQESTSVLPRYRDQEVQRKFPGGEEKSEDGGFLGALHRELLEETYLRIKDQFEPKVVYDHIRGLRRRVLYSIPLDCLVGKIRSEPLQDGTSMLGDLRLFSLKEAEEGIYRSHREGLRSFIRSLRRANISLVK